jgi:hypothetical protein
MKPALRNVLIGAAVLGAFAIIYAKDTIDSALTVFEKITMKPSSFPKQLKLWENNALYIPQKFSFNIDILISNPAFQEFYVTGFGVVTLKTISIYWKDFFIGTANLGLDEITVPPQSSFILKDVHFEGNTLPILNNLNEFVEMNIADLKFTGTIEALGLTYEIG